MSPEKAELEHLIKKYTDGNCTPEERETLFSWLEQLDLIPAPLINDQTGMLLKERIDKANGQHISKHQLNWWNPVVYVAASNFLAILFIFLYYNGGRNYNVVKPSAQVTAFNKKQTIIFYNIINTGRRPHLLKLDDGSTVLLESNSTLLRQVPFAAQHRKVELHGKAFFRIAKDKNRPFDVFSGNITTTALGTSFWVNQNMKNASIQVRLVTGKVVIRDHRPERQKLLAYLIPGQQLSYDVDKGTAVLSQTAGRQVKKSVPEPHPAIAPLVFAQTPMNTVLDRIADYYKVSIKYNTEDVRSMAFYGKYTIQDNVELILKTITVSNGLTLTKTGDSYLISK